MHFWIFSNLSTWNLFFNRFEVIVNNLQSCMGIEYCNVNHCWNPSLGLMTKAKTCKGAGQEWSSGVTFHAPGRLRVWGSVRVGPPHSQVNSHFGSWTPIGFPDFHRVIVRVKIHWIEEFFISLEISWNVNV